VAEDHEQQDETEGQEISVRPVTAAARREQRAAARAAASTGPTSEKVDGRPKTAAARAKRAKADADAEASRKVTVSKADQGIVTRKRDVAEKRPSPIFRLLRFLREVVSELRKVIWPTRKQQITYTVVVLVFVAFVVAFVSGLDYGFTKLVFLVFS
jgi:preprotein translocase subunit SecE